jgi:inorganic pyrophosphatase
VNYGYIDGIIAPDGEEQDAYVLGINEPIKEFTGTVIAIIHRNRCYVDYLKQGYVIGNNINIDYERDWDSDEDEDEEKFAGAFNIQQTL